MVCTDNDPNRRRLGGKRLVEARLSGAKWKPCCSTDETRTTCDETVDSREKALALLVVAGGECLEKALHAVKRYSPEDMAAAYLVRAERNRDPVDLLRALETAKGFNRALALERLRLTREAIHEWDAVSRDGSDWGDEARGRRDSLLELPDPVSQWRPARVNDVLHRGDRVALTKFVQEFPADAVRKFEGIVLSDINRARLLASILASTGDGYPQAVMDAIDRSRDAEALQQGLSALRARNLQAGAELLERAGNPMHLAVRSRIGAVKVQVGEDPLPVLDAAISHLKPEYRELSSRLHTLRAIGLDLQGNYLEAHAAYESAIDCAKGEPTSIVDALSRRSENYTIIGSADAAFRDAHRAVSILTKVTDLNAWHQAYGAAAMATKQLGYPEVALHYQSAAVDVIQKADPDATTKKHLAVALRALANLQVELGRDANAEASLKKASELADAAEDTELRAQLQMRVEEVRGQALLETDPAKAVAAFTRAIELREQQDSTYRAVLYFKRSEARRNDGDPRAHEDIATALGILRQEAKRLLETTKRGEYEDLWTSYFSRFQEMHHRMVQSRIDAGDAREAFVQAELARALEPLQLLLQSQSKPAGFRPIESKADLDRHLANLPNDTVILHYLVLKDRTYTWVLTRENFRLFSQRAGSSDIERLVTKALNAVKSSQDDPFEEAMREAYDELFRGVLAGVAPAKTRIVVIPDGPMHGLPFNGLKGVTQEGFLIERASIATAGSTSLYLYALARDAQFTAQRNPSVLLAGDPAFDPRIELPRLPFAKAEVEELARDYYNGAEVLTDAAATVPRFLAQAKNATIIHFAGHGIANPQSPWLSRLLLAAQKNESGELTAERLMQELSELARTRLVVLGGCSTAGGHPVGPQGLSSLVRPLIAANVPAVVGTLWDVKDATTKQLLVSLHCHYRHGDDVAVALRNAQLEMLRKQERPMRWAPFQVVGYAASPYARSIALEEPNSEHVCSQNSLQRPDGLHSQ